MYVYENALLFRLNKDYFFKIAIHCVFLVEQMPHISY